MKQPGRIQVLDRLTANQIAAGEVVERPASVIKELVENAIDAAATRIDVKISGPDCQKMQVIDNGIGMIPEDLRKAFERHATSKIRALTDLDNLFTLGFRGEALPSIAAVSQFTITSKVKEAPSGYKLQIKDGKAGVPEETAARDGTIVQVERLFYNAPARQKFLKSPRWELGLISEYLQKLAFSQPQIAFRLYQGEKLLFATDGSGDIARATLAIYGKEVLQSLVELEYIGEGVVLSGLVSLPDLNRSNRNYYNFFVNGRWVKSRELSQMVDEAYRTILPAQRYPVTILNLRLPMQKVDVNVHPAKLEIKFQEPERIKTAVLAAISAALLNREAAVPRLGGTSKAKKPSLPVDPQSGFIKLEESKSLRLRESASMPLKGSLHENLLQSAQLAKRNNHYSSPKRPATRHIEQRLAFAPNPANQPKLPDASSEGSILAPANEQGPAPKLNYSSLRIIGQVEGTYIIVQGEDGIYFIDQHAAHERILYERLSAKAQAAAAESALLAIPLTIRLTPQEHIWLTEGIFNLTNLGFVLEHFGDDSYIIRGVPLWYTESQPDDLLRSLLEQIAEQKGDLSRLRQDELFLIACKQAIKANRYLTDQDISALLSELDACANPGTCPHGRPTAVKLTFSEIRKRFLRSGI